MSRSLAHIEEISKIEEISGADKIEKAIVLGWECVVKKGDFKVGQKIIYCEVDSIMPDGLSDKDKQELNLLDSYIKNYHSIEEKEHNIKLREELLKRNTIPEYEFLRDRKFRIKTIKLKGQISQGLILPLSALIPKGLSDYKFTDNSWKEGDDVTELLGITKYLSPSEQSELQKEEDKIKLEKSKLKKFLMRYSWFRRLFLSRKQKEGFPYWVSKTDEERVQNIPYVLEKFKDKEVYITEKVDYQSVTFTGKMIPRFSGIFSKLPFKKYQFIVCSRNLTTNDKNSLYWKIAKKYNLEQILKENPTLTIQGEQGDTKVQGNKYSIKEPTMWVFNIIDHGKNYHYNRWEMEQFCKKNNLQIVPLLKEFQLYKLGSTVQELVEFSKGKSVINPNVDREGIVVRCIEDGKKLLSFKVINPDFLIKHNL